MQTELNSSRVYCDFVDMLIMALSNEHEVKREAWRAIEDSVRSVVQDETEKPGKRRQDEKLERLLLSLEKKIGDLRDDVAILKDRNAQVSVVGVGCSAWGEGSDIDAQEVGTTGVAPGLLIAQNRLAEAEEESAKWEARAEKARRELREIEEALLPTYDTEEVQHAG